MTVPFLPDSAPFTPSQRAYLNGFFAGLLNVDPSSAGVDSPGGGTAMAEPPEDLIDEDNMPWHDPSLTLSDRMELVEDKPQEYRLMAAMAQLDCGACGYLCRTYSKAIADGEETDLNRCVPGGGETAKKLKQLLKEAPAPVKLSVNGQETESDAAASEAAYDRDNPFPSPVLAVKKLNREGSAKDVRFVALDLTGSGITYDVGDALGVFPDNCGDHVQRIIDAMGVTGNEPVAIGPRRMLPLREALMRHRTITAVDEDVVAAFAEVATDEKETAELKRIAADEAEMRNFDVLDLLCEFPSAKPHPADLVSVLPTLQPRLYSISSSQAATPNEVHLTVGVVRYELEGRQRRGVASTFFADRVKMGDTARIFIQKAHAFGLPAEGETPIIMVGPGTGIAPFRAFLQQRAADGSKGKNWLFFGDQKRSSDYLYEHELERWSSDGLLTRIDLAFSRDQEAKVYVQNRMREAGDEIWAWLEQGAHFYVCGDATRMARDVDNALREIIAERGGMSADEAGVYIDKMSAAGRYQRDVY